MAIGSAGENLVFLISQPRAGSTLLQRVLGAHPQVLTVSEPWLLLPPLYALRDRTEERSLPDRAGYGAAAAHIALKSFRAELPAGDEDWIEGVRRMYGYLYNRLLEPSGRSRFLDKTPRYYFIVPELRRAFPAARFVFLLRNPLAVLDSIRRTWVREKLWKLSQYRSDLLIAPKYLVEAIGTAGEEGIMVRYEDLVARPAEAVTQVCGHIGLDFAPAILDYGLGGEPDWRFGDPVGVRQHSRPTAERSEDWIRHLREPQAWRLASDYLDALGEDLYHALGYDFSATRALLEAQRPARLVHRATVPMKALLEQQADRRSLSARLRRARLKLQMAALARAGQGTPR